MKKFVVGTLLAIGGLNVDPVQAQEECVGIENDVARLQCFDQAFVSLPSLSPGDALEVLNRLSNGVLASEDDSSVTFLPSENECQLQITLIQRGREYTYGELDGLFRVWVEQYRINLSDVVEVSTSRTPRSVSVSMKRDRTVDAWKTSWPVEANLFDPSNDIPQFLQVYTELGPEFDRVYNDFWVRNTTERTEDVRLVAEPEDLQEATRAFEAYVAACSES